MDPAILNRQISCQDRNDPCPWETMCVRLLAWGHSFLSYFLPRPNAHRALRIYYFQERKKKNESEEQQEYEERLQK